MQPRPLTVPRSWADLTPEWMTAALCGLHPGLRVGAVSVGQVVRGTNDRATVHLQYRAGTGPPSVFVKREGRWPHRLALAALGAADAEARLALAVPPLPLEHPEFLAAGVDRRRLAAVVVLEDVRRRGGEPNRPAVALDVDDVADGLRGLARLHAAHWGRTATGPASFVRPWRLGRAWAPVSWASLARALRLLRTAGAHEMLPSWLDAASVERGFRGWAALVREGPQTLLHGDPHPGNTYRLPGGGTGFYDWQLVRTGSWVHDVGYFLVGSLDVAGRRAHERDLLAAYLAELSRTVPGAPGPGLAWEQYRGSPVFGLGTWLHTLSGGAFQPREDCVAMIGRFAAAVADLRPGG